MFDSDEVIEELLQCRRCGLCREAVYAEEGFNGICPVWRNTSGFETAYMRGKIMVALALLENRLDKTADNVRPLFECTLCGNCTQICPAEFQPNKIIEQVRALLSDAPNDVRDSLAAKVAAEDNPYGETASAKTKWLEELDFDVPERADTIYFVGCTSALRTTDVAKDTAWVLHHAGIEFAVMRNEPCCGSVLLRTGKREEAVKNAERVAERIAATGANRIVVSCAGCYKTLKEDFAEMGVDLPPVLHVSQLLAGEAGEDLTRSAVEESVTVTYHDPCHLGRETGVYEEPRQIVSSLPGVTLVEMETNRAQAMCCGAGGGLRSFDSDLAKRIARDRIREARETGAEMVVTACPFCEHNLSEGARLEGDAIDVVDIVSLVARRLK